MDAIKFGKWAAVLIGVYVLIKLLRQFGLLGKTDEEIKAEKFKNADVFTNAQLKKTAVYLSKKLNKPVNQLTKTDLSKISPLKQDYENFVKGLADAKGVFNDDETKIYSAFRSVNSLYHLNQFNEYFVKTINKSIPDYLSDFMSDKEIAPLYDILVKTKPI